MWCTGKSLPAEGKQNHSEISTREFHLFCRANRYKYELLIVPGLDINGTKPLLTIESNSPPIHVNPIDFGGAKAALKVFTLGVRLKSENVSDMAC